jgi:hypothetical protein
MAIPNKVDAFPNLSKAVRLPPRDTSAGDRAPRRRRREAAQPAEVAPSEIRTPRRTY